MDKSTTLKMLKEYMNSMAEIPNEEWEFYIEGLKYRIVREGETYCPQGEFFNKSAYLSKGLMESYHIDEHTHQKIIKRFYTDNMKVAPYKSMLEEKPSDISIVALEDSHLMVHDFSFIKKLRSRHICWEVIGRKLAEQVFVYHEKRTRVLLLKTAEMQYIEFLKQYKHILNKISDKKIAEFLGISPISLSRIKKRMKDSNEI